MIKVGFICEGRTEQVLLQSDAFRGLLHSLNIVSLQVIDANGAGNLLPHNISAYILRLENEGAEAIVILTDQDEDFCISATKMRIQARPIDTVIIATKKIESWFLACTPVMQKLLARPDFEFDLPENEPDPFATVNSLLIKYQNRGVGLKSGGKVRLVNRMLDHGFDILCSAAHANCPSAKYFIEKLRALGTTQST